MDDSKNNLPNFYFWCTNRIIPPNRQYVDAILKSLFSITSKEPVQIALQCSLFISNRCLLGSHL